MAEYNWKQDAVDGFIQQYKRIVTAPTAVEQPDAKPSSKKKAVSSSSSSSSSSSGADAGSKEADAAASEEKWQRALKKMPTALSVRAKQLDSIAVLRAGGGGGGGAFAGGLFVHPPYSDDDDNDDNDDHDDYEDF